MSPPHQEASFKLTRSFRVPRARVFQAWTDPEELKKWWQLGHGWKLNVAQVDLRVGGKYRIGLTSTSNDAWHQVSGTFKEVSVPERLVYTWNTDDSNMKSEESLVTVEFHDKAGSTELVLRHDRLTGGMSRQNTYDGWLMVLDGLVRLLG